MFVVSIEGTDGSGKATQTKLLFDYLTKQGFKTKMLSFPNYENRGCEPVKMYLGGEFGGIDKLDPYQVNALFAVDRLTTIAKQDFSNLDFLLLDRYTQSSMIHQSALTQNEDELNKFLDWVNFFEFTQLKLPRPDKIIFLDVPVEISNRLAKARAEFKDKASTKQDIYESNINHLKTAYKRAKYIAKKFNWQRVNCVKAGRLKSVDEIHAEIKKLLKV